MKKKNSLILDDEFLQYCQINKIDDVDKLAKETFNRGFTLLKYGEIPTGIKSKEKIIEKEIIKEIPVEKIVEVIKEIPIKIETTINDDEVNQLKTENQKLKEDLGKIMKSLDSLNKAKFLKNSDLNSLYGE